MVKEIKKEVDSEIQKKACGIIMPIADSADYPLGHWRDVYAILCEAIDQTEFEPKLVSEDLAVGLIHDRIVTNIYNNEIVVCDVSSKNPNVMFELGLRLAFDKPTIIIKDESTGYSFDTGVIEHLNYPSSLRFGEIVKFKEELIKRINATYKKSSDADYSPFLKSFGKKIKPASIQTTEIPEGKYILEQLEDLRKQLQNSMSFLIEKNALSAAYVHPRRVDLGSGYTPNDDRVIMGIVGDLMNRHSNGKLLDEVSVGLIRKDLSAMKVELSNSDLLEYFKRNLSMVSIK
jgi:hypothetical protein